jgi:hypothetical protein
MAFTLDQVVPWGRSFGEYVAMFALCSHLLFLYSEQLSEDFHVQSIKELCRVAAETRVFPLLELGTRPSRHVQAVAERLTQDGYSVQIEQVPYEFQRGGNQMMRVSKGSQLSAISPQPEDGSMG